MAAFASLVLFITYTTRKSLRQSSHQPEPPKEQTNFVPPEKYSPKLNNYNFMIAAFQPLKHFSLTFSEIHFPQRNAIIFVFKYIDDVEKEDCFLYYAFDMILAELDSKEISTDKENDSGFFLKILFDRIAWSEAIARPSTILSSAFIRVFCLVAIYENKYIIIPTVMIEDANKFTEGTFLTKKISGHEFEDVMKMQIKNIPALLVFTFSLNAIKNYTEHNNLHFYRVLMSRGLFDFAGSRIHFAKLMVLTIKQTIESNNLNFFSLLRKRDEEFESFLNRTPTEVSDDTQVCFPSIMMYHLVSF